MKFQPSVIPKLHKSVISIELFQVRNIYCCKLKAEQEGNYVEIGPITFSYLDHTVILEYFNIKE